MSHTTTIRSVKVTDLDALRKAVADLKNSGVDCDLVENAQPRMYFGNQSGKCEYMLRLNKGRYDVGFQKQKDGSYAPIFDEYQNYVGSQIGAKCALPTTAEGRAQHQIGQLMQGYAKHAAINAATQRGYVVEGCMVDPKTQAVHITLGGIM